jgi:lipopolysaccharide export system permease protein
MTRALNIPGMRRLRLSSTISAYMARQYAFWYFNFLFGLTGIIFLVTLVDLLDRLANKNASLGVVFRMAALKLPFLAIEVMPFTVLLAGLTCFWRLTRAHELVVTRAAGVSIWQLLTPVLGVAVLVGVVTVTLMNPLASVLLGRFEQLEARYVRNQASTLAVSPSGLWLRQASENGQSVIHAKRVTSDPLVLYGVTVFHFSQEDRFRQRVDAERAELGDRKWLLYDALQTTPGGTAQKFKLLELATELTREKIQNSFAPPETISFWLLPDFIELLENAGFSAVRHKLQLHRLLAIPMLFAAMVLLAATFSLRTQRRGHVGLVILGGVMTGFLFYFLSNFVFALGLSAKVPVVLAAWTPAGISLLLGIAMLLHLEDG